MRKLLKLSLIGLALVKACQLGCKIKRGLTHDQIGGFEEYHYQPPTLRQRFDDWLGALAGPY